MDKIKTRANPYYVLIYELLFCIFTTYINKTHISYKLNEELHYPLTTSAPWRSWNLMGDIYTIWSYKLIEIFSMDMEAR